VAGIVQVFLSRALGLRYVGFGASGSISLPLLEREEKTQAWDRWDRKPSGATESSTGEGKRRLRILSHNVWCHMLQQWYAPPASKRLDCLFNAIEEGGYDVVMLQELFLLRCGPLANTRSFETFTRSMLAAGNAIPCDVRRVSMCSSSTNVTKTCAPCPSIVRDHVPACDPFPAACCRIHTSSRPTHLAAFCGPKQRARHLLEARHCRASSGEAFCAQYSRGPSRTITLECDSTSDSTNRRHT